MEPLSVLQVVVSAVQVSLQQYFFAAQLSLDVADLGARYIRRVYQVCKLYGISGIPLSMFGNQTTWRIQAQILGQLNDGDALAFKESVYNECTMIAVAAAIVAQIAITGLSLDSLSQTHWVARACFVLSVTFALMAVYYATTQQRTLGRLLNAKDVRLWIRGGRRQSEDGRIVPSFHDILMKSVLKPRRTLPDEPRQDSEAQGFDPGAQVPPERPRNLPKIPFFGKILPIILTIQAHRMGIELPPSRSILRLRYDFVPSDPDDYTPPSHVIDIRSDIIYHCFTPSAASVITISAPQMLLSSSLAMLLIALGIYFGFKWTRNLDTNAEPDDSRNVFITYIVGLTIAGLVYFVSKLFQNEDKRSELQIVEGYVDEYLAKHPEARNRWRLDSPQLEDPIE